MRTIFMALALLLSVDSFASGEVVTLRKGDVAPFSGTLLSPEAAAKIIADSDTSSAACEAEIERSLSIQEAKLSIELERSRADVSVCESKLALQEESHKREISLYDEQLRKQTRRVEPAVVFSGGVVAGIGLTIASAWALSMVN